MQDNIQLPEKLIKAFPTRDLQLTPLKGDGGIIRLIFLVLVLIGLTVFVAFQLPGIAYDYTKLATSFGGSWLPLANLKSSGLSFFLPLQMEQSM